MSGFDFEFDFALFSLPRRSLSHLSRKKNVPSLLSPPPLPQSPAAQRLSAALSPPLSDAETTARAILRGTLSGKYLIPTDARSGSLVAAVAAASTSPGVLPWPVAALLAPLLVLLATAVRFGMEFGTKRALESGEGGEEAVVVDAAEEKGKGASSVAVAADGTSNGGGGKKKA